MSDLRKEFEALPSIRTFMRSFDFDEAKGEYVRSKDFFQPEYTLGFYNGAWYAFQEKQKQIDLNEEKIAYALKHIGRCNETAIRVLGGLLK